MLQADLWRCPDMHQILALHPRYSMMAVRRSLRQAISHALCCSGARLLLVIPVLFRLLAQRSMNSKETRRKRPTLITAPAPPCITARGAARQGCGPGRL